MANVLIYADTVRSPELRHEIPLTIPDPFLYAERIEDPKLLEELDAMLARRGIDEVDIPYRAELWITHRRREPAPPAARAAPAPHPGARSLAHSRPG